MRIPWSILTWPWRAIHWAMTARPIHFTRFGTFYILFTLAVGAAAINTGNNLLYLMLGLLLGFIIVSGVLSDSCLWDLQATWTPVGDFYAGQPVEMDLNVTKGWFPAILVTIEARWSNAATRHLFYWVPRHEQRVLRVRIPAATRGRLNLLQTRYATRFPFGLFEKTHHISGDESWVVFPAVRRLSLQSLQVAGSHFAESSAPRKGQGTIPFDLREFRSGDSSKYIHWKSSAKRQRLMIAEREEESDVSQRVAVTHWPAASADREAFISFVASLVFTLYQHGRRVSFSTPGAAFETDGSREQLKKILTYLALLDPDTERAFPAPRDAARPDTLDAAAFWEAEKNRL